MGLPPSPPGHDAKWASATSEGVFSPAAGGRRAKLSLRRMGARFPGQSCRTAGARGRGVRALRQPPSPLTPPLPPTVPHPQRAADTGARPGRGKQKKQHMPDPHWSSSASRRRGRARRPVRGRGRRPLSSVSVLHNQSTRRGGRVVGGPGRGTGAACSPDRRVGVAGVSNSDKTDRIGTSSERMTRGGGPDQLLFLACP